MGYLTNFITYTLAMVGIIMVALFIFKQSANIGKKSSSKFLKVIDTMSIGPRKNLYIVSAGQEKFLIAGDVDRTTLISKLETNKQVEEVLPNLMLNQDEINYTKDFREVLDNQKKKQSFADSSVIGMYKNKSMEINGMQKTSVMRMLAERMKQ